MIKDFLTINLLIPQKGSIFALGKQIQRFV